MRVYTASDKRKHLTIAGIVLAIAGAATALFHFEKSIHKLSPPPQNPEYKVTCRNLQGDIINEHTAGYVRSKNNVYQVFNSKSDASGVTSDYRVVASLPTSSCQMTRKASQ